jgi:hypothetical protein
MGMTGPVRLLLDENMDRRLVPVLHRQGVDVRELRDIGLLGADDTAVLQAAFAQGRVLVTRDCSDYPGLIRSALARGVSCPPVLLVPPSYPPQDVGKAARAIIHWVRSYEQGQAPLSEGITWLTLAPEDRPADGLIREAATAPYSTALRRIGIELPSIV